MDLRFLRDVIEPTDTVATVYLDASHDSENAATESALRWDALRSSLVEQGADDTTLAALDAAVVDADPPVGPAGRVVVARGGEVVFDRYLREPPAQPRATWRPLPDLLPALLDQPEPVAVVVVRVDKQGGEILVPATGDGEPEQVAEVSGREHPLHKVRGGGWAHLRMQHKVEETWRQNVRETAARVDEEVRRTAARVLVIAGEEQSRAQLRRELTGRSAEIAVDLEYSGGRQGPDAEELEASIDHEVLRVVAADKEAVLDRYQQASGRPDGLAADGIEPVLAALRAEAVDTLLLDGGVRRDVDVWISEVPTQLATDESVLRGLGAEPVGHVPVDAALVRAAAGSGAALVLVGGGRAGTTGASMGDGVAALLRYPLPPDA